jgi:hypothetical protein
MKTGTKICAITLIALGFGFAGSAEAKKGNGSGGSIGQRVRSVAHRAVNSGHRRVVARHDASNGRRHVVRSDRSDWSGHHNHDSWRRHRHHGFIGSGFYFAPSYSYGYWPYSSYYRSPYYYDYAAPAYYYSDAEYYPAYAWSLGADVQSELARRGYYRGAIDGIIGRQSRNALRAFQRDVGLPITGQIDSVTLHELGLG